MMQFQRNTQCWSTIFCWKHRRSTVLSRLLGNQSLSEHNSNSQSFIVISRQTTAQRKLYPRSNKGAVLLTSHALLRLMQICAFHIAHSVNSPERCVNGICVKFIISYKMVDCLSSLDVPNPENWNPAGT